MTVVEYVYRLMTLPLLKIGGELYELAKSEDENDQWKIDAIREELKRRDLPVWLQKRRLIAQ